MVVVAFYAVEQANYGQVQFLPLIYRSIVGLFEHTE
jgi:hypothetical protein